MLVTRTDRKEKRDRKICEAFYQRYTLQPRPRKVSREHVVAQLADEFFLSPTTIERIVLPKLS